MARLIIFKFLMSYKKNIESLKAINDEKIYIDFYLTIFFDFYILSRYF